MIYVLLAVMVITGAVVYFGFFKTETEIAPEVTVAPPREIKINFEFLDSQALKDLQPFAEIPPYEGTVGRENPFITY